MKTLLLVRHAKSSWADPGLPDHERTLNHRGRQDAPEMGRRMKARGVAPDTILSSTALRARATAELIAGALDFDVARIVTDARIYAASPSALLDVISAHGEGKACVMLVGHNPELSELAGQFSQDITGMPTCAVAEFRFAVADWSQVVEAEPAGVQFDYPKRLA